MDKVKLPLALVLAMAVQLVGAVWWVSKQSYTIDSLREEVSNLQEITEVLGLDVDQLILFATFTENRWAEAYAEDMTYIRQFGTKAVPKNTGK
tara:strand:- start:3081 stop:3359 length:279 start_codon:yes stop_codon:yes gene_type:complete